MYITTGYNPAYFGRIQDYGRYESVSIVTFWASHDFCQPVKCLMSRLSQQEANEGPRPPTSAAAAQIVLGSPTTLLPRTNLCAYNFFVEEIH